MRVVQGTAVIFCFLCVRRCQVVVHAGLLCACQVGRVFIYLNFYVHADSAERLNTENDLVPHEPIVVFFQWDMLAPV